MLIREISKELEELFLTKGNEKVTESEADTLIAVIVNRCRTHPDIARGASVRGAIAFKEILLGFGAIQNGLTRSNIEKAAMVTLPSRISIKQGSIESASDIVISIVKEVLWYSVLQGKERDNPA